MKIVDHISLADLKVMAESMYGSLVKADIGIVKKIVIMDMEMHADGEAELLENGSKQTDLWGINQDYLQTKKTTFDGYFKHYAIAARMRQFS